MIFETAFLTVAEKSWAKTETEQSFVLDKEFFEKVKNQFVEKNQEEEN